MNRPLITPAAALAVVLGPALASSAATFLPVGQTRTVSASATTTAGPGATDQQSDAAPGNGPFASSKPANIALTFPTGAPAGFPQTATVTGTATAGQTSTVTADLLSGSGTSAASSVGDVNGPGLTTSTATSAYSVQFTVPVPTQVVLAGSISGFATYHLGALEHITDNLSLAGSDAGVLYSLAYDGALANSAAGVGDPAAFNTPASFTALLTPGQTYTLSASTLTNSVRGGVGQVSIAPANAGFTVSLSAVPEPASAGLFALAAAGSLGGRRRRA